MIYVFLADGFEEIEAIAPIDILRRANLNVVTVKVGENKKAAVSSHNIALSADIHEDDINLNNLNNLNLEMIVLPGGGTGVENLYNSEIVKKIIEYCVKNNVKIGAICAAPSILARFGYLKGVRATAYPSFRHYLAENGAILEENQKIITDSIFTTAAAAGVSIEFGLELANVLSGKEISETIGNQILFYQKDPRKNTPASPNSPTANPNSTLLNL